MITELNDRSREILKAVVDAYVESGEPVGSRTLSRRLGMSLSPATIRNVMADLEEYGLLMAPHHSAGRVPTEAGLRLFVHGILEIGDIGESERNDLDSRCASVGKSLPQALAEVTQTLSGLSSCAGLVLAPKTDRTLRQVEFLNLGPGRVLAILVTENGIVENRVIETPVSPAGEIPASALAMAANFINARLAGRTLDEVRVAVQGEVEQHKTTLDALAAKLVKDGVATLTGDDLSQTGGSGNLIVRGQSKLLEDVTTLGDLERLRSLFDALETKETIVRLLDATGGADGVQIFIGAESSTFSHTGCTMIISPYRNSREKIIGAIGVIGPTRINYARIIPMVDYTAKLVGRLIG